MLVLLESIESQNRATIEAVSATRNELRQEMASFRAEVEGRFTTVEAAIRQNSRDIRELKAVVTDHTTRLERIETRLDGVEARLERVEARLDGVEARLERVETRLEGVETRLEGVETRLEGVEARLERVEVKLEQKADTSRLATLETRVAPLLAAS